MNQIIKIPFNKPYLSGKELAYIGEAVSFGKISGNGVFTHRCQSFFEERYGFQKCLLTTSCTAALEMAALLCDIQPGDEVIVPSFTFVSSANAFVLRGAKIIFVDSRSDHPNLDESLVEELITPKTKAIVVVHYGGYPCEMDTIMDIARRFSLFVVEDAAQAIDSYYKGKALGSIGHLGTMSFHETKNIQCGEGGMLMINDPEMIGRAEVIWEKGTDRVAFSRGEISKYGWQDIGSSFLPSELNAAYLWAQLENIEDIQQRREAIWNDYANTLTSEITKPSVLGADFIIQIKNKSFGQSLLDDNIYGRVETGSYAYGGVKTSNVNLPSNHHLFYLLFPCSALRDAYSAALNEKGILTVFHYQSLHKSEYAKKNCPEQYQRNLPNSDRYSDCLLRLPLFYELPEISN